MYAGNGILSLRRTYIKFNLPVIPDGSVVTNSELKLLQHDINVGNEALYLYAVDLTGQSTWSESSITWNNQPLSKTKNGPQNDYAIKKIDYTPFIEDDGNQEYIFNLTKTVKNWYEGSANNGIMISSNDETKNSQTTLYSSDHSTSSYHPTLTIGYTNNIGHEDYWTYETRDLGRSGSVYANPYNGSITYLHNDLNMTGNLLPINISHVYNSNTDGIYSTCYENMYVGAKYHLSIQELLIPISTSDSMYSAGYRYKYYDADGTLHYFKNTEISYNHYRYTLEYDPTTFVSYNSSYRMINYSDGSKKYFYNDGRLYKIVDNNGNTQTFTYDGKKITRITDPCGRVAILTYNQYNQLVSITDPSGKITSYSYSNTTATARLTSITYPDGKQTIITYTTNDYLSKLTATDNSFLRFYYRTVSQRGRRVNWIDPYDKNGTRIDEIKFTYTVTNESGTASGNTVISNNYDESKTFLFDKYGRAISITNQYGQSHYAIYGDDVANNSDEFNKILSNSDLLTNSKNLLKNHGFERNEYWSILQSSTTGSCGYSTEESSFGYRSGKMELTENSGVYELGQDFVAAAGETYTIALDICIPEDLNVSDNNGVSFGFVYCLNGVWYAESSRWLTSTNGWERFSHTVTIPGGELTTCRVFIELARAKGKVYFDNVQVENSAGPRYYNLVENSDFSNTPDVAEGANAVAAMAYAWSRAGTQGDDGVYTVDGRNYLYMSGSPNRNKRVVQTVPINAKVGDTIIIGGRAGAYATDGENDGRHFRAYAELYDGNLCFDTVTIDFDRSVNQEHQTRASVKRLSRDCEYIIYYFVYFYHLDSVSFDDAFIYLDKYGEHYSYENGLLDSSYNDEGKTTSYSYSNNNVTKITEEVSGVEQTVADYSYDSNHNVTTATSNSGTEINFVYNSAGQITGKTTTSEDETGVEHSISESFEYYQGGNYIKKHIDETGGVTIYEYDNVDANDEDADSKITKGLVTSVTDPNGNTTTYTYNPNTDETVSVSGMADYYSSASTTSFTYENYLPKTMTKNGTMYSYEYDSQNRITSSKVGTQTLATNSYDNRQRLSQVSYANNASYSPVYDSRDRLVGDLWNGLQISEYYYNENDRLSKVVDNVTGVSYQYDYAFYGLPFRVTGSDGALTRYDYTRSGSLARLTFSKNDNIIYSGKYYKNEKGQPEDVIIDTLDNAVLHYNYDHFGRLESYSNGPIIYSQEYFPNGENETNQIEELSVENKNGTMLKNYNFRYDANGNLSEIIDNGTSLMNFYYYDELNRLIGESIDADSYNYFYDAAGNITQVKLNGASICQYTYSNTNWKDQLTSFNGFPITYDANGNPLTYKGYTYTWQRGTQLAGITGNGKNISYVYDSQGNRVQKTVNGITTNYFYSGDMLMRQTEGNNTLDFQYDASGKMVGFVYNGTPYFYLHNLQNDIIGIADEEGTIVADYEYDAYGNLLSSSGTMAGINPIRYRGYYYDAETNWYYLLTRYYNPEWRRFISPDCLFIAGNAITGNNMYAYCNGNPVSYVDSSGKITEEEYKTGNAIRRTSKVISWVLLPATVFVVAPVSNLLLDEIKRELGDDPTESPTGKKVVNGLDFGANNILANLTSPISPNTYDTPTGLRHFMPVNMAFGAPWAVYFLGFEKDENCPSLLTAYTTKPGKKMWQSRVGYDTIYDLAFSLGGPVYRRIYDFELNTGNETKYYVVWIWKGDYWNLGVLVCQ